MTSTGGPDPGASLEGPLQAVRDALRREGVDSQSHLLLALSGGGDSTALLVLLCRYLGSSLGRITAAYFRHGLQAEEEQGAEEERVRSNCELFSVPLLSEGLPPGDLAKSRAAAERGVEAAAREARYAFLYRTAEEVGATHLLTAHHRDDQNETILMRLLTGGGLSALRGIEGSRDVLLSSGRRLRLLRPLLGFSGRDGVGAEALRTLLRAEGIECHGDASNRSERFLRNRIRLRLVPLLEELVPGYSSSLARLAGEAREVAEALDAVAGELPVEIEGPEIRFPGKPFWSAPTAIRRQALLAAVNRVIPGVERLPDRFLRPILYAPAVGRDAGHGVELLYDATEVRIRPLVVHPAKKGYFSILWEGSLPSPEGFRIRISGAPDRLVDFDCPGIVAPLVLRTRRPGDHLDRFDGSIRVNRLLAMAGVDPAERDTVILLEDRKGVLAVVTPGVADKVHLSERCHTSTSDRPIPDTTVILSENGIKVEYAKRQ